jgi:O-antigen/teichoic acid export membrane protein
MQNKKILVNFIWRFAERCGAQLVTFIVSIVLARILAPEDYGTIALITVFTTILQVFVDSGLGTALIQKKNADDMDFSSVFYFNFIVCIILYICMFFPTSVLFHLYTHQNQA